MVWLLLGLLAGIASFSSKLGWLPFGFDQVLTPFATLFIGVWALSRAKRGPERKLLLVAYIFAVIADALLAVIGGSSALFLGGLGFFLLMQVIYAVLFSRRTLASDVSSRTKLWTSLASFAVVLAVATTVVIGGGVLAGAMASGMVMTVAVIVYALAISIMVSQAIASWRLTTTYRSSYVYSAVGATVFMASDMLIALTKFGSLEFAFAAIIILATYWIAQALIALSLQSR